MGSGKASAQKDPLGHDGVSSAFRAQEVDARRQRAQGTFARVEVQVHLTGRHDPLPEQADEAATDVVETQSRAQTTLPVQTQLERGIAGIGPGRAEVQNLRASCC